MSGPNYRRVPHREGVSSAGSSDNLEANITRSRGERLTDKLVAVAWVVVALLVARWTQFYSTLWSGSKPNRNLLAIAFLGVGINTVFMLYLVVYLPKWKKLSDSSAWSIYCPRVIPAMTGVGIATFLIFVRALWPVWGFLAPLIFGTQVMGLLFGLHFIPIPSV